MTPEQWRLSRRVLEVLAAEAGLTDRQIAGRLGVTAAELRPVLGSLYRQHRVDFCWGYVVLPPPPASEVVRAA